MKRNYETLNGIRGVAAVLIVARHASAFFGGFAPTENFLAVDLFFVLSGFVLAHAYGSKLDERSFIGQFLAARVIRLYPLYVLGSLIGVAACAAAAASGIGTVAIGSIPRLSLFAIVGLPAPSANPNAELYPLNSAHWSLFFEMLANLVMALTWRKLNNRTLLTVSLISAIALLETAHFFGTVDTGYNYATFVGGLARVGFSFPIGILLYHVRDRLPLRLSPVLVLAATAAALSVSPPAAARLNYEFACIFLLFPLIVLAGAGQEPKWGAPVFHFLGLTSYAIYAVHLPTQRLVHGVLQKIGVDVTKWAPLSGIALVLALLLASAALDRFYDGPVRRWLWERYRLVTAKSAAAPTSP